MTKKSAEIVSQMQSWDTSEIETSFLATCVFFLESEAKSPDDLCELIVKVEDSWFLEPHKKAIFYVVKKIVTSSSKSSFVVPGSIAVMAEKILLSRGYKKECELVEGIASSPSMFFDLDSLFLAIPLWRAKLARRRLRENTEQMLDMLDKDPDEDIFENKIPALIEAQQEIWHNATIVETKNDDWDSSINELLQPLPKDISISTGLTVLDNAIQGGIAKRGSPYSSRLIIVAARPSMGKSTLAIYLATQLADSHGDVAFFSLEMSRKQVQYKSIACFDYLNLSCTKNFVNPIRSHNLRLRSYTTDQRQRLEEYKDSKFIRRFHIYDSSESIRAIEAKIKVLAKTRPKLSAVFVDYLQLIEGCSGDANNTEASNIGHVTRALKKLATNFGIDVILLSQVNRGVENRTDKMPNMADLRASGRIEEDADIVMFLLRPSYYDKSRDPYELAISVAKNRHGECGILQCSIDLQSSVIFDKSLK